MPKPLRIEVDGEPHADAEREAALAVDALADALAGQLIARARREVPKERGVAEESIDREHGRVTDTAQRISALGHLPAEANR